LNNTYSKLLDYSRNQKVRQIVLLYSVNVIGIPLGIFTSIVITKYLGAEIYGDYSFLNNIFNFGIVIFTFGFFQAGNRALVLTQDKNKVREIYGAVFIITLGLFIVMILCLGIYGILDTNLKSKELSNIFFYILPFSWIFLLTNYFETLYQADNRITELSKTRLYPKIGFFLSALIIYFLLEEKVVYKHGLVWVFYLLTLGFVYLNSLKRLKLSFQNFKINIKEIWEYNKSFGFDVYIGSVLAVGFASLSGVIISYFGNDNTGVGFYTLAFTFASPLTLIPNVIATTHYKEFAQQNNIPKKLTKITIGLTLLALVVLWIMVGPFIDFFYEPSFHPVVKLNFIISIGMALHGLADYYNRFLGAHGKGKILRNSSIIIGISLLAANVILIPIWGATGAAYARLIGGVVYFFNMIISYQLFFQKSKIIN